MFMLRVITAGQQTDTMFDTREEVFEALRGTTALAFVFQNGGLIGSNSMPC